jgi:hypothetical protein
MRRVRGGRTYSALTSFSLNCGPQQASDIVLIKHKRVEAQISSDHDRTRLVALGQTGALAETPSIAEHPLGGTLSLLQSITASIVPTST